MSGSWDSAFAKLQAGMKANTIHQASAGKDPRTPYAAYYMLRAVKAYSLKGHALAQLPLGGSSRQIRKANHLMLMAGYCYLRLFSV